MSSTQQVFQRRSEESNVIYEDDIVLLTYAKEEEKIAAVLYCLSESPKTVREARDCAANITPVGEKMVSRIMLLLQARKIAKFNTYIRKWQLLDGLRFPSPEAAIDFVYRHNLYLH